MRNSVIIWLLVAAMATLAGCAWGLRVETRSWESDGRGSVTYDRDVWGIGTVTNLPVLAECQVDSQCHSGYCKEVWGSHRNPSAISYGHCVPDQPVHYHVSACFHDVETPGILKELYQHRVDGGLHESGDWWSRELGPLGSTRPGGCPAIRIPGTDLSTPYPSNTSSSGGGHVPSTPYRESMVEMVPPVEHVTLVVVDIGSMWVFDGEPWGQPFVAERNDLQVPSSRVAEMSDLPKPRVCRAARVADDLWIDCAATGRDRDGERIRRRGMGPPYRTDRGDVRYPGYFYVPPPPPPPKPGEEGYVLRDPTPLERYFIDLGPPGAPYGEVRSRMDLAPPVTGHHPARVAWEYYYTTRKGDFFDYKWAHGGPKYQGSDGDNCLCDRECNAGLVCQYSGVAFTLGECRSLVWTPDPPGLVFEPLPPPTE